jgi:hypothetical protein
MFIIKINNISIVDFSHDDLFSEFCIKPFSGKVILVYAKNVIKPFKILHAPFDYFSPYSKSLILSFFQCRELRRGTYGEIIVLP